MNGPVSTQYTCARNGFEGQTENSYVTLADINLLTSISATAQVIRGKRLCRGSTRASAHPQVRLRRLRAPGFQAAFGVYTANYSFFDLDGYIARRINKMLFDTRRIDAQSHPRFDYPSLGWVFTSPYDNILLRASDFMVTFNAEPAQVGTGQWCGLPRSNLLKHVTFHGDGIKEQFKSADPWAALQCYTL